MLKALTLTVALLFAVPAQAAFCPGATFTWERGHGSAEGGELDDGSKYIIFDPEFWRELTPVGRKFIWAHECSHAYKMEQRKLFHRDEEFAADKDAFERGVKEGWIRTDKHVSQICYALGTDVQSHTHPSSFMRCLKLWQMWASHKSNQQNAKKNKRDDTGKHLERKRR